jgi:hypothetical protein
MNQIAIGLWQDSDGQRTVRMYGGPPAAESESRALSNLITAEIPVRSASKRRPIKFATGSPQLRSGIWRVWSPTSTGDVYVMPQSNESFAKISLHESGDWRFQVVSEKRNHPQIHFVEQPDSESRVLDQWTRPTEFVDGWTDALTILVPQEDIAPVPNDPVAPSAVPRWMSEPPPMWCSRYRLQLIKDDAPTLSMNWPDDWCRHRVTLIGAYRTAVGETVLITHDHTRLLDRNRLLISRYRHDHAFTLPTDFDTAPQTGPRCIAHTTEGPEQHRIFFDLASFVTKSSTAGCDIVSSPRKLHAPGTKNDRKF